jgi:hypothetical protein
MFSLHHSKKKSFPTSGRLPMAADFEFFLFSLIFLGGKRGGGGKLHITQDACTFGAACMILREGMVESDDVGNTQTAFSGFA